MDKKVEIERMMMISNEFYKLTGISKKSALIIDKYELIPITVNCTFSIELALKCLYYANNNEKIDGHNIKKLYSLTKGYGLESFLLNDFTADEIDRIVNQLENAFVEFRYLYEQKKVLTIQPPLLKDFTAFINGYCTNYINNYLHPKEQ